MNSFSLEALLGLYSIPGIGPARMRKLISVLGSPEAVLQAAVRQLTTIEGIDLKTASKIHNGPDQNFVKYQLSKMASLNVGVLTFWDKNYPSRLKRIYDPPAFLFYKGRLDVINDKMFAVVGTRAATTYGRYITDKIASEIAKSGLTIISGFARGIDTIAHKSALKNNVATVAVLGNGIDQVYPAENKKLFDQMVEQGLFLSEYPLGTKPDAGNFPKRNRIISGMSCGVLVTEAGLKSGALLTAMYALDQNREVFAVPGPLNSAKSMGTNNLIKGGAKLVQGVSDIVEELQGQIKFTAEQQTPAKTERAPLTGIYKTIYELLDSEPMHIDQIAFKAQSSPSEIFSALLTLELRGYIRQLAGKMFIQN